MADSKKNMVVLKIPKPMKTLKLYTRTHQEIWLNIGPRKSWEEVYRRELKNRTGRSEKWGETSVEARKKEGKHRKEDSTIDPS
ncbi:glucose-6-phosphate 1-dehydrogenase 4 [Pyrus ussuriensis x Pyrus communis]|uniref:Glucose-6-phosphate 1-dehydrogenase 4 n=1 Tax=Pyrus ussuriensis x Pyrus communis TaxID=2448454 RepID=A0A5N5GZD2_9ROSA|nr:glucose-6-phosphate 1-dehydrogenase 4 [Pyrus ussuriensis x Pyrus communis]